MSSIAKRLDVHFVACAAAAGAAVAGTATSSQAAIVYSGAINLATSTSTNGLYINIVNGQINEPGNTGGGTVPGWDLNIYGSSQTWWSGGQLNWGFVGTGSALGQLAPGTLIDGTNATNTVSASGSAFPVSPSPAALFGFRFFNEVASQVQYGWGRYYRTTATGPGVLVDFAYDNTGAGIQAGAVPAPGSVALLALGALGLAGRRRK